MSKMKYTIKFDFFIDEAEEIGKEKLEKYIRMELKQACTSVSNFEVLKTVEGEDD